MSFRLVGIGEAVWDLFPDGPQLGRLRGHEEEDRMVDSALRRWDWRWRAAVRRTPRSGP
jgi:hypothetical protein